MNEHRPFWEPSSPAPTEKVHTRTERKFFGKITVSESDFDGKFLCFTDDIKESVFDNPTLQNRLIKELTAQIRRYFVKYRIKSTSLVLVAGIGNENITADSLGCRVCDGLIPSSNGEIGKLSFVKCGVGGVTGIESHMHLSALAERLKPSIIIVVDTLAANTVERLSSSLQISDKGISPGKGVGNEKKELSFDSMSVPIIAIGVPLVIYAQKILAEYFGTAEALPNKSVNYLKDLVVTSDNIDFIVKDFAKIISESINAAVFGAETA